ncbi:uncharacterized protein [Malus domestica]|uniref:uncharacterized protein n=1 Tax=Malus domestica TaxID=3750 RepID=UPI003975488E
MSKQSQKEDEKLLEEEEELDRVTAREEHPLSQPPKIPKPSNSGKFGSNFIPSKVIPPNVPFPCRFKQSKKEKSEKDILETFRKVQVNILLLDAIKQVPKYAKFLKKLCTTKKRILEKEVVHVSENVSAVLQQKLPPKCKYPDLGASINVMPYSVYASMNLGELKKDGVIIQLVDRSNAYLK